MVAGAVASRRGSITLEKSNLSFKCPFKTISSNFNSSLSSSRLAGDAAADSDMISKFLAENITTGNEVQDLQVQPNKEWQIS
jgi:hypothetical protein